MKDTRMDEKEIINQTAKKLDKKQQLIEDIRHALYEHIDKVERNVREINQSIWQMKETVLTVLGASGIWLYDAKVNKEDRYLLDIAYLIWLHHDISYDYKGILHYKFDNHEFDLVIVGKSREHKDWPRVALVEFKDSNFPKLVEQAVARKEYGHYVYVAYSGPLYEELPWRMDDLQTLVQNGIGLIYTGVGARSPVLFLKARTQVHRNGRRIRKPKHAEELYNSVESWVRDMIRGKEDLHDKFQRSILDYLSGEVIK